MKKIFLLLVLVIMAAAGYFGWQFVQKGFSIDITQEQIQAQLTPKFPIQKNILLANITLSDPKVTLKESSDRVFIGANVAVTVPTQPKASGATTLSGKVVYAPEQGAFVLSDMRVEELKVPGVSSQILEKASALISEVGAQVLNRFPIYTLDPNDRTQKLAKSVLKSVNVVNGKLRVSLGI